MATNFVRCFHEALNIIDRLIYSAFGPRLPPYGSCLAVAGCDVVPERKSFNLEKLFEDGFLWAVPRNRRTIEKRMTRKYGSPEYKLKIYVPKTNLLVCNSCGHNHEAGVLCPHCYEKVIAETKEMQEKIQESLGLSPVEQDVVVLYDGEQREPQEFWQGKRIVEMKKERPSWFSKNLMQQSTQTPATSSDAKPTDLA